MPGAQEWWSDLGNVTKCTLGFSALLTVLSFLKVADVYQYILVWDHVISRRHLWRLLTCFFYLGNIGGNGTLGTIFSFVVSHQFSTRLEDDVFNRDTPNFVWLYALVCPFILLATLAVWFLNLEFVPMFYLTHGPLQLAMIWIYCYSRPEAMFNVFSFIVPAPYLPFVYVGVNYCLGGGNGLPIYCLGIATGWCYMYLKNDARTSSLTRAPQILRNLIETGNMFVSRGGAPANDWVPAAGQPPQQPPPPPPAAPQPPAFQAVPGQPAWRQPPAGWGMGTLGGDEQFVAWQQQMLRQRNNNANNGNQAAE